MKNKYLLIFSLFSAMATSQQTISFETAEGYTLGDINGQNGWTVTESSDGLLTNQIVTNEFASSGQYAFKNAHVAQYGDQWFPIFGIAKSFSPSLDYKNTTISYDFYAPQQNGSDFEFALYNINQEEEVFDIVTAVGFENRGFIYIYPELNLGGFTYANEKWEANKWYNMKIEITETKINYYLNNKLILSVENKSKLNIDGMNFLHNNFGGDAYYDNIRVNNEVLAVNDIKRQGIKVFPNPVKDILKIQIPDNENISEISIYNLAGQKIKNSTGMSEINTKELPKGNYLVKVKTDKGQSYQSKLIKE